MNKSIYPDVGEGETICKGCNFPIDVTTCQCGEPMDCHSHLEGGHAPTPMGCKCHLKDKRVSKPPMPY